MYLEEGPAGISAVDAALQPSERLVGFPQRRVDAGDLLVGVMRMSEGLRAFERFVDTLKSPDGLFAARVQHGMQADDQRFVGVVCQCDVQPLLRNVELTGQ